MVPLSYKLVNFTCVNKQMVTKQTLLTIKNLNIMKKNEVINETENIVIEPIMDEETMQAIVDDNLNIVPKNQRKKFDTLTLQQKVAKIQFYHDINKMREDARIKNSLTNKVKELFERRKATVQDAKDVMKFCADFIDTFKLREIARLDEEIHRLELMKESLA